MVKEIKNEILNEYQHSSTDGSSVVKISNSIIKLVSFPTGCLNSQIIIENSIIETLFIHASWFNHGLILRGNLIKNEIDYQMGGHNKAPILIERNVFHGFFNFFDCHFIDTVEVCHNIFLEGASLLGNIDTGYSNLFDSDYIIDGNIGRLDIDT